MTSDEWDDYAAGWDSDEDVRLYAARAFDSLNSKVLPHLPDLAQSRVLDFGCGTGLLSGQLAALCRQVVAVDPSAGMIAVMRAKIAERNIDNLTALQTTFDATAIDQQAALAGPFDLIIASSVCSFLPDYAATLRDLSVVMKPGGYFVQWDWLADMPAKRIQLAYRTVGLKVVAIEEAFALEMKDETLPVVMGVGQRPA